MHHVIFYSFLAAIWWFVSVYLVTAVRVVAKNTREETLKRARHEK